MKVFTNILLLLCTLGVYAQQDPMYTQYVFNMQSVNPAYAGSRNTLTATILSRWQWIGIQGAPSTQTFTTQTVIPNSLFGVGLSITKDKIGPLTQTQPYLDVAYHVPVSDEGKLSFGIKTGLSVYQSRIGELLANANDPNQANVSDNVTSLSFGAGVYYYQPKMYIGISIPRLSQSDLSDLTGFETAKQVRHLFVTYGFVFDASPNVKVKPSVLMKDVKSAPIEFDLTTSVLLYDKFWLGATYRTGDGMGAMMQVEVNDKIKIGYAYDYPFSQINQGIENMTQATHELMLGIEFRFKELIYKTSRYF